MNFFVLFSSGNDAFSKKEHAEEARWARRRVRKKFNIENNAISI